MATPILIQSKTFMAFALSVVLTTSGSSFFTMGGDEAVARGHNNGGANGSISSDSSGGSSSASSNATSDRNSTSSSTRSSRSSSGNSGSRNSARSSDSAQNGEKPRRRWRLCFFCKRDSGFAGADLGSGRATDGVAGADLGSGR